MTDEEKAQYKELLTSVIHECLDLPDVKHGLLIVASDDTETFKLFSINTEEDELPALLATAARIITARLDIESERTLN